MAEVIARARPTLIPPDATAGQPVIPCPKCGKHTHILWWHRDEGEHVTLGGIAFCDDSRCNGTRFLGGDR